jgi:hypothetical protein
MEHVWNVGEIVDLLGKGKNLPAVLATCPIPRYFAGIDESRLPWTSHRDRGPNCP